jgi:hypothetical protein
MHVYLSIRGYKSVEAILLYNFYFRGEDLDKLEQQVERTRITLDSIQRDKLTYSKMKSKDIFLSKSKNSRRNKATMKSGMDTMASKLASRARSRVFFNYQVPNLIILLIVFIKITLFMTTIVVLYFLNENMLAHYKNLTETKKTYIAATINAIRSAAGTKDLLTSIYKPALLNQTITNIQEEIQMSYNSLIELENLRKLVAGYGINAEILDTQNFNLCKELPLEEQDGCTVLAGGILTKGNVNFFFYAY